MEPDIGKETIGLNMLHRCRREQIAQPAPKKGAGREMGGLETFAFGKDITEFAIEDVHRGIYASFRSPIVRRSGCSSVRRTTDINFSGATGFSTSRHIRRLLTPHGPRLGCSPSRPASVAILFDNRGSGSHCPFKRRQNYWALPIRPPSRAACATPGSLRENPRQQTR